MTFVHRRRAGVIRKAGNGDVPAFDADDAFNDADVDLVPRQRAPLLDVQLEIAGNAPLSALPLIEPGHLTADEADSLLGRLSAERHCLELGGGELAAHGATAE